MHQILLIIVVFAPTAVIALCPMDRILGGTTSLSRAFIITAVTYALFHVVLAVACVILFYYSYLVPLQSL